MLSVRVTFQFWVCWIVLVLNGPWTSLAFQKLSSGWRRELLEWISWIQISLHLRDIHCKDSTNRFPAKQIALGGRLGLCRSFFCSWIYRERNLGWGLPQSYQVRPLVHLILNCLHWYTVVFQFFQIGDFLKPAWRWGELILVISVSKAYTLPLKLTSYQV